MVLDPVMTDPSPWRTELAEWLDELAVPLSPEERAALLVRVEGLPSLA